MVGLAQGRPPGGCRAHPSNRFDVNSNHFQLAMLAYNLNCWLMLFNREPQADAAELRHTTLATSRLRFLFRHTCQPQSTIYSGRAPTPLRILQPSHDTNQVGRTFTATC
jgi:hypothetical protein